PNPSPLPYARPPILPSGAGLAARSAAQAPNQTSQSTLGLGPDLETGPNIPGLESPDTNAFGCIAGLPLVVPVQVFSSLAWRDSGDRDRALRTSSPRDHSI